MRIPPPIKQHFIRWHRRFGIFAALFIIMLAATGFLLNHTSALLLDKTPAAKIFQTWFYGVEISVSKLVIHSSKNKETIVTQLDDETLYFNTTPIEPCHGDLIGVKELKGSNENPLSGFLIACTQMFLFVSETGNVLERIGEYQGLPIPLASLGLCEPNRICFADTGDKYYQFVQGDLDWLPLSSINDSEYQPTKVFSGSFPDSVQSTIKTITSQHQSNAITRERLLLDLHSGRLFGAVGVWIVDIVGVLVILLALSGLFLWFGRRR